MYLPFKSDPARLREAERARRNRLEIVKARSIGEVTRRDLLRWGAFTSAGLLACKNGLSPFASSAYGQVPTGTPRSPLFGVAKFTQKLQRAVWVKPTPMLPGTLGKVDMAYWGSGYASEYAAKRHSYHNEYSAVPGGDPAFCNPTTKVGPMEGRPPGAVYAHQRWDEFFPKVGYCMSWAPCQAGTRFHPDFPDQHANSVWTYGVGRNARGSLPPFLIKARYGEPILMRVYNNTPVSRTDNNGFGRNETQLHFHNAHNGPRAMERPGRTTCPGHSTTTFGARHWHAGTASTRVPPTRGRPAPTTTAGWSRCPAIIVRSRGRSGRTTIARSSLPRTSTRAMSAS